GHLVAHPVQQNRLSRLVILETRCDVQVASGVQDADRVHGLGTRCRALLFGWASVTDLRGSTIDRLPHPLTVIRSPFGCAETAAPTANALETPTTRMMMFRMGVNCRRQPNWHRHSRRRANRRTPASRTKLTSAPSDASLAPSH